MPTTDIRKEDTSRPSLLNNEAIHNLTGFFDVLIQMDFALKLNQGNKIRRRNEKNKEKQGNE
jgi:hypothetical protein